MERCGRLLENVERRGRRSNAQNATKNRRPEGLLRGSKSGADSPGDGVTQIDSGVGGNRSAPRTTCRPSLAPSPLLGEFGAEQVGWRCPKSTAPSVPAVRCLAADSLLRSRRRCSARTTGRVWKFRTFSLAVLLPSTYCSSLFLLSSSCSVPL